MEQSELKKLLQKLISTGENEVVEFKQGADTYSTNEIGKYFSALANEANLRDMEKAWLVFGVEDKIRTVVGTNYRLQPNRLQGLKQQIAASTEPERYV